MAEPVAVARREVSGLLDGFPCATCNYSRTQRKTCFRYCRDFWRWVRA